MSMIPRSFLPALMFCAFTFGASGCGDDEATGPVEVFAIAPDSAGQYAIRRVPLDVRNPRTLENDKLLFVANATIVIHSSEQGGAVLQDGVPVNLKLIRKDRAY